MTAGVKEFKKELELFVDKLTSAKLEETYSGEDWFYKGTEYFDNGNFIKAASAFENAFTKDYLKEKSLYNAALSCANYDVEKARSYFEKLEKLYPAYFNKSIDALGEYASILSKLNKFDVAEGYYKQAISLNRNDIHNLGSYGYYLFKNNRYDEALENTEKALSIETNKHTLFNKGHILLSQGKFEETKQVYEEGLSKVKDMTDLNEVALDDLEYLKSKGTHTAEIDDIIGWMKKSIS